MPPLLEVKNLHARVDGNDILRGLDLTVNAGEVHAIMGPNGSGKSTLANVLAGRENYQVTQGTVLYKGRDLLALAPEARAAAGVFLAFQYPVEIPGVGNLQFLRASLNSIRKGRGEAELDVKQFMTVAKEKMAKLGLDDKFLRRNLNEGFSGGEKKRNEIFQMTVLEPELCVMDETDSGLDIDALKAVAQGINDLRGPKRGMVLITHYQRLLNYVVPDRVHVLQEGRIGRSGGKELAHELEARGYAEAAPRT